MTSINEFFDMIVGWLKAIVELLLALAVVFLVIDLLFGPQIGIIDNVANFVTAFTDRGVIGLIMIIIFLAIYKK